MARRIAEEYSHPSIGHGPEVVCIAAGDGCGSRPANSRQPGNLRGRGRDHGICTFCASSIS